MVTKGEITKEYIIKTSAELFLKNGFYNTGLSMILEETKLPKGSFYYHFKSKGELGIAVAEYFKTTLTAWFSTTADKSENWNMFAGIIASDIREMIRTGKYYGCPFTCFATETAVHDEEISRICTEAIEEFIKIFACVMEKSGLSRDESVRRAGKAMALYEGMLVYFRISGSEKVIDEMERMLIGEVSNNESSSC